MDLELCQVCSDATGRAGKHDDSLFSKLLFDLPGVNFKTGDTIGPLCLNCFVCLGEIGALTEYEE
jgi:hypothetical protein